MENLTDEITKLNKKVDKLEKNLADLFGHVSKLTQIISGWGKEKNDDR